jgi:hypothetical protein
MKISRASVFAFAALSGLGALAASGTSAWAACKEYQVPKAFSIRQNNGFAVTVNISAENGGDVTGSAHYGVPQKVGAVRRGSFDGRVLNFRVNWSGGGSGNYEGSINNKGKLVGVTRGGGGTARFESIQRFECVG